MTIKTTKNASNNRGDDDLKQRLRSIWLSMSV